MRLCSPSQLLYTAPRLPCYRTSIRIPNLLISGPARKMSNLSVELTAPNGKKYTQPTGLFINNEWVGMEGVERVTRSDVLSWLTPSPKTSADILSGALQQGR